MTPIGNFSSLRWGVVEARRGTYGHANGPLAVVLFDGDDGQKLANLSVNMYPPECSHCSTDLPADCFYVKTWDESTTLVQDAIESGLFIERNDLPQARSGFVSAPVWQIKPGAGA